MYSVDGVCGILLQLVFLPDLCGSICSSVHQCVRVRGVDSNHADSFESDSDSLDNSATLLPHSPHRYMHQHCVTMPSNGGLLRKPSVRGQLIINLPAK